MIAQFSPAKLIKLAECSATHTLRVFLKIVKIQRKQFQKNLKKKFEKKFDLIFFVKCFFSNFFGNLHSTSNLGSACENLGGLGPLVRP
jgi:hypothetical protein